MTKKLWMLFPYNSNIWPNQNNLMKAKIQIGMNWSIASLTSVYTDRLLYSLAVPHLWLLDLFALGWQQSPLLLSRMNRFVKKTPGHEQLFKYTISPPSAPSILFLSPIYCCSWRIQCPIYRYGIEHLELCGALLMARMFFYYVLTLSMWGFVLWVFNKGLILGLQTPQKKMSFGH